MSHLSSHTEEQGSLQEEYIIKFVKVTIFFLQAVPLAVEGLGTRLVT